MPGGEGRTGRTGSISSDASFETLGQANNALNKRLRKVEEDIRASQPTRAIAQPSPLTPWPLTSTGEPNGEFDTVAIAIPFETGTLRMWIKRTLDGLKAQHPFDFDDITQAERIAQRIERTIPKKLDYLTSYDLMALTALKEGGGKAVNQNPDGITPLLQWTTGANIIGTGTPINTMGLERANVGGTQGTNTTTEFYLDIGASSVPNAYVGTGELQYALYINAGGSSYALNPMSTITAYDEINKKVTVSPAMSSSVSGGFNFEIHRGIARATASGTGHSTTVFKLDTGASSVDHHYDGTSLYIPSAPAGQQIQKVSNYVGSTRACTLEPAPGHVVLAAAPINNTVYMICMGSFGYANIDLTGAIAPVPLRTWFDTDTLEDVFEAILPTGQQNAIGITTIRIEGYKVSNGRLKFAPKFAPTETPTYRWTAQTFRPSVRMQLRNLYRGGGSDGWGAFSYYLAACTKTDTVSVYTPDIYVPIESDFHNPTGLPGKENWVY